MMNNELLVGSWSSIRHKWLKAPNMKPENHGTAPPGRAPAMNRRCRGPTLITQPMINTRQRKSWIAKPRLGFSWIQRSQPLMANHSWIYQACLFVTKTIFVARLKTASTAQDSAAILPNEADVFNDRPSDFSWYVPLLELRSRYILNNWSWIRLYSGIS